MIFFVLFAHREQPQQEEGRQTMKQEGAHMHGG